MELYRLQMKAGSDGETVTDSLLARNRITAAADHGTGTALSPGAIVMVHKGAYPVALVKVLRLIPENENDDESFGVDHEVEILSRFEEAVKELPEISDLAGRTPYQGTFRKVERGNDTYHRILTWVRLLSSKRALQTHIRLLQMKGQIILQGPPGTGKTRLAKQLAAEVTKAKKLGSPKSKIDEFFKTFDPSKLVIQQQRATDQQLLQEFHHQFPKDSLKSLSLDRYAIGKGTNDSFCWWMERGLKPLGYYFPGSSRSYLVYWDKEEADFSKHGLLRKIEDQHEAMKVLASIISDFIETQDPAKVEEHLGDSFLLKLLHSYYPSEYMPINSERWLTNALKLVGVDYSGMNAFQKNKALQEWFQSRSAHFSADVTNLEFMRFLDEHFDLKGDIAMQENALITEGEYRLVQFHPAYSYEDFVRGISAKVDNKGRVYYEAENKILAQFADKALNNPSANFVLIIDEINRANLPAVLGELIYAFEYRYNPTNVQETTVEGIYALKGNSLEEQGTKILKLPKNLYFIGTMNTADRSVGHIDYAIRRRFAFVDVLPSDEALDNVILDDGVRAKAKALYQSVGNLFGSEYLAPDFQQDQVQLGHSYYLVQTEEELSIKLEHEIKPILREYVKDGILLGVARTLIEDLHA